MLDALMDAMKGPEFLTMVVVWGACISYGGYLLVMDRWERDR